MFKVKSIPIAARLPRDLAAFALVMFLCGAPSPASAHIAITDSFEIQAQWVGLEERDAEWITNQPILSADLTNNERDAVRMGLNLALMLDGQIQRIEAGTVEVRSRETVRVRVTLPLDPGALLDLQFSGRLTAAVLPEIGDSGRRHADSALGLPNVWFHSDGQSLRFYREDVLRAQYGGGNYRGTDLRVPDATDEMEEAIARTTGSSNLLPVLGHVAHGGGTQGGDDQYVPPGARKFCLVMDGGAFVDSSVGWIDFGEDFGRAGTFIPLSRAWVVLGQNGSALFTGFLDGAGCTPHVFTNLTDPVSVAFIPMAENPLNSSLFVSDLNLGPDYPDSMPFFLLFFNVVDAPVNYLEMDTGDFVQVMFSGAANCLQRASGGMTDALYEFQARQAGDAAGTATNYGNGGHPRVQVKYVPGALSKFMFCHEYAHGMNIADLSPPLPLNPTGLDYSVEAMEPQQHTMDSKEWNLAAAIEGFAHLVSATVWNDVSIGADGVYVDAGATPGNSVAYPLDTFDQLFLNDFGAAGNPGQGVELDWAQFFWAWRTDGVEPQNVPTMVDVWYEAYPWPVNEGFYIVFESAADTVLADPDELDRMIQLRTDAGIVP